MIAVNITPLGLTVDGHAGYAFENDVKMYGTQTKHREIIKDSYTWNFKNVAYSA